MFFFSSFKFYRCLEEKGRSEASKGQEFAIGMSMVVGGAELEGSPCEAHGVLKLSTLIHQICKTTFNKT